MARHTTIFYDGYVPNIESRKNSRRIQVINSLVSPDTETVWDICCDHGQIGLSFLPHKEVHFVDIVPAIMERLELSLLSSDIPRGKYHIHLSDAKELCTESPSKNNCFIIVGIGADLIIQILKNIPNSKNIEYIVCAHQYPHKLRDHLIQNQYFVQDEVLVQESGQFYEILKISKYKGQPISPIGEMLWDGEIENSFLYLKKRIAYFNKKAEFNPGHSQVLEQYRRKLQIFLNKNKQMPDM